MTQVTIIIDAQGFLESVLTDSEINLKVLHHDKDALKIDEAETLLEAVDIIQ